MSDLPITQHLSGDDLMQVCAENPDKRFELIEGQLIEMPPTGIEHGHIGGNAYFLLKHYNKTHQRGWILQGETGFFTREDKSTVRAADVVFISYDKLHIGEAHLGYGRVAPELIVDVVSPSDRAGDIEEKVREWLAFGVLVVWVIYPKTRRVHVYEPNGQATILTAEDTITGGAALPDFQAQVSEFFEN